MHVRVDDKKLSKALNGKSKTIKITPGEQDDTSKALVKLQFKDAKKGAGIGRKLLKGKPATVKMSELDDIIDAHTGGSIFGKIKDIGKSVVSSAAPVLKGLAKQAVSKGSQLAAKAAADAIQQRTGVDTSGITSALANVGSQAVNERIGSGIEYTALGSRPPLQFNDVRERMAHVRSFRKPKGAGFMDSLKKVGKTLAKEAVSKGSQFAAKKLNEQIQQRTGVDLSPVTGQIANLGATAINDKIGSGTMSQSQRMAWVRSHKGKRGGSFRTLGGSFSQL